MAWKLYAQDYYRVVFEYICAPGTFLNTPGTQHLQCIYTRLQNQEYTVKYSLFASHVLYAARQIENDIVH